MNTDQLLKLAEVVVSLAIPLTVLVVGAFINRSIKKMEIDRAKIFKKKEMRKAIYDDISEKLNIIACYVADVGDFGEFTPDQIIAHKRHTDRRFKSYQSLWSDKTTNLYDEFIESCFKHFSGGLGTPAKIRTMANEKQAYFTNVGKEWKTDWNRRFTGEKSLKILEKYRELTTSFVDEFVD